MLSQLDLEPASVDGRIVPETPHLGSRVPGDHSSAGPFEEPVPEKTTGGEVGWTVIILAGCRRCPRAGALAASRPALAASDTGPMAACHAAAAGPRVSVQRPAGYVDVA